MKFRLVEDREFFDDIIKKKKKKNPVKGKMGWFTSFLPDKEKGLDILNKNLSNDISVPNTETTVDSSSSNSNADNSAGSTDGSTAGCSESLLVEDRLLNTDGTLTRKAQILIDVYENSGMFSKKELLRRSGYPNWNQNGHWSTQWAAFSQAGLITSSKGKVFAGPTLEDWIQNKDVVNINQRVAEKQKAFNDKVDKEFELMGIKQIDANTISFPDNYFDS